MFNGERNIVRFHPIFYEKLLLFSTKPKKIDFLELKFCECQSIEKKISTKNQQDISTKDI